MIRTNTIIQASIIVLTLIGMTFAVYTYTKKKETPITPSKPVTSVVSEKTETGEPYTIIAFGDSLTAGYGVPLEESYPALLEEELQRQGKNVRVINMGVSGETTTGSLDRVNFIIAQKPSLVLLALGANDMLRATSPKTAQENIEIILRSFLKEDIDVVLLGMKSVASNGQAYREEFDALYPSLATLYNLPFVPFFLEGVALVPQLNTADTIHPNKAGYEKIIKENILPVLLPVLTSKGL